ncbi:MAG: hypothetical protein CMF19_09355 [Idiomarinaceae bacterium]|nr:hypothetical protein [Idiomarinaceae bacterium]
MGLTLQKTNILVVQIGEKLWFNNDWLPIGVPIPIPITDGVVDGATTVLGAVYNGMRKSIEMQHDMIVAKQNASAGEVAVGVTKVSNTISNRFRQTVEIGFLFGVNAGIIPLLDTLMEFAYGKPYNIKFNIFSWQGVATNLLLSSYENDGTSPNSVIKIKFEKEIDKADIEVPSANESAGIPNMQSGKYLS